MTSFALIEAATSETIALWCSTHHRILRLSPPAYRLDFLELAPKYRGGADELRVFLMGAIAARALECGAKRIVLFSTDKPQLVAFYRSLGGEPRLAKGCTAVRDLVPFEFVENAVQTLAKVVE
ncbi:hypothetical protein BH09MYX1_BH09MYX1_09380 [soil metagenome]